GSYRNGSEKDIAAEIRKNILASRPKQVESKEWNQDRIRTIAVLQRESKDLMQRLPRRRHSHECQENEDARSCAQRREIQEAVPRIPVTPTSKRLSWLWTLTECLVVQFCFHPVLVRTPRK